MAAAIPDNRAARLGAAALAAVAALAGGTDVRADADMARRIAELAPALEAYVVRGMESFDVPGVAVGFVTGDKLVYAKGFGTGRKGADQPVGPDSVFQIGSTTKAFLAATLAMAADAGRLGWDDRVVELYPGFQLADPWVTREFRVADLMAQRSGLPPNVNDAVGILGFDQAAMIRSLAHVEPTSSFRNRFSYTNITHMLAERIVAERMQAADWAALVADAILAPLGMADTSLTAEAIAAAPKATAGHVWTAGGAVEAPFTPIFPYGFGAAGAINSTVDDMAKWLRLQLAQGTFEGRRLVSAENLAVTRVPRVGMAPTAAYAMGWVLQSTPNGRILWHNGGTFAYGAYVGLLPDKDAGIVVLTNQTNVGMPDAVGAWALDRLLGNPETDHLAVRLAAARAADAEAATTYRPPTDPRPAPPLDGLTGSFRNSSFGTVEVAREGEGLVAEIAGTGAKLRLAAWDGDVFVADLVPEGRFAAVAANLGPYPLGFVTFRPQPDGGFGGFGLTIGSTPDQPYDFVRE